MVKGEGRCKLKVDLQQLFYFEKQKEFIFDDIFELKAKGNITV